MQFHEMEPSPHSRKVPNRHSLSAGFTLVELMIVVVIVAILAAMAAPSYRDFLQKARVKDANEGISAFIAQAKSEAILRDRDIEFDFYSNAGSWCIGFTIDTDDTTDECDCSDNNPACTIPVSGTNVTQIIGSVDFPNVTVTPSSTGLTTLDSVRGTMGARSMHVSSGNWGLSTVVSGQGRIRVCTDTTNGGYSKGVTGFEVCN